MTGATRMLQAAAGAGTFLPPPSPGAPSPPSGGWPNPYGASFTAGMGPDWTPVDAIIGDYTVQNGDHLIDLLITGKITLPAGLEDWEITRCRGYGNGGYPSYCVASGGPKTGTISHCELGADIETNNWVPRPWTAGHAWTEGEVSHPSFANLLGHAYVCIQAGTSGASEPTWPRTNPCPQWAGQFGITSTLGQVADGTAVWEQIGRCAVGYAVNGGTLADDQYLIAEYNWAHNVEDMWWPARNTIIRRNASDFHCCNTSTAHPDGVQFSPANGRQTHGGVVEENHIRHRFPPGYQAAMRSAGVTRTILNAPIYGDTDDPGGINGRVYDWTVRGNLLEGPGPDSPDGKAAYAIYMHGGGGTGGVTSPGMTLEDNQIGDGWAGAVPITVTGVASYPDHHVSGNVWAAGAKAQGYPVPINPSTLTA